MPYRSSISPTVLRALGRRGVAELVERCARLLASEAEYEERWAETNDLVTKLMAMPPDDARLYRRTASVILPESALGLLVD